MKIKTSELTGAALDWVVAKCEGLPKAVDNSGLDGPGIVCGFRTAMPHTGHELTDWRAFQPSANWAQAGPIIEREDIDVLRDGDQFGARFGRMRPHPITGVMVWGVQRGPTKLIAACRCFVASRLGDEIEVPEELL